MKLIGCAKAVFVIIVVIIQLYSHQGSCREGPYRKCSGTVVSYDGKLEADPHPISAPRCGVQ